GTSASALLARRKSILDNCTSEITSLKSTLGSNEKAKLDAHLTSIQSLQNKLMATMPTGGGCMKPTTPVADATYQYMTSGTMAALKANQVHQQIIANAFACDITR